MPRIDTVVLNGTVVVPDLGDVVPCSSAWLLREGEGCCAWFGQRPSAQVANEAYLDQGVKLLELAQRAHVLFKKQEPREKRRLLDSCSRTAPGRMGS
jgi:hypothetical protein